MHEIHHEVKKLESEKRQIIIIGDHGHDEVVAIADQVTKRKPIIISNPDLVIAQGKSGVLGSFPALNARPKEQLDDWLYEINEKLGNDRQVFNQEFFF